MIYADQRLDWAAFNDRVNRLGNALIRAGIGKGDRVATVLPNSLDLLTLYWAVTAIGGVIVPTSPLLQPNGLANLLRDSGSRLVFLDPAMLSGLLALGDAPGATGEAGFVLLGTEQDLHGSPCLKNFIEGVDSRPLPDAGLVPDDLFNIAYSSGTTGEPKGIVHTHLIRAQYGAHFAASFRMTPESVVLQTGSIVFNGAFVTLMPAFFLGATYILHTAFDVEKTIRTIREERVTHAMLVPAQIIALLESPNCSAEALESLEMVLTLGAPLSQSLKERLNAVIPDRFYELYGLTEGVITILDKYDFRKKPGSVGCPQPGNELRIQDEAGVDLPPGEVGEIVGRGPLLTPGYYGRPALTAEAIRDGWMYTGDLGYLDADGYLYLAGRKKELIISGGINVFPVDIEEVAMRHPDVLEATVFGVASERWGETPVAAVVLKPGAGITREALLSWINARVGAKYQRLSDLLLLDEFPRNVAGKVQKYQLRESYREN